MTTERVRVEPDALAALAALAGAGAAGGPRVAGLPAASPGAPREAGHGRRTATLAGVAVVAVAALALVVPGLVASRPADAAGVVALAAPQQAVDRLSAEDAARLAVEPASARLLVVTDAGGHYVARTPSGELCLIRSPGVGEPTEVCVPDRVGADATIGTAGTGQVRLVADGAPSPSGADGWEPAGPNVWVRR